MPESSNKGGRIRRVSDEDLLDVFRSTSDPVLSTAEVADAVPIKRRGTLKRLQGLGEDGALESKQIGGRNTVWWLTAEESRETPTRDAAPSNGGERSPGEGQGDTAGSDGAPGEADFFPDLRDDLPGSGENLDGRIQAVRDIYEYLKKEGRGKKGDFKEVVDIEATGYGGKTPFESFWNNCMNSGAVLEKLQGVRSPGEGGHNYTYEP